MKELEDFKKVLKENNSKMRQHIRQERTTSFIERFSYTCPVCNRRNAEEFYEISFFSFSNNYFLHSECKDRLLNYYTPKFFSDENSFFNLIQNPEFVKDCNEKIPTQLKSKKTERKKFTTTRAMDLYLLSKALS
jgi:hypothetical protein